MTARTIHQILTGAAGEKYRRTFQPVRCNSFNVGEREHRLWRPINKKEIGLRMKAAERFDRTQKEAGRRNGPLGHIGLEVLRELYRIVDYKTGRLDPSIDYIMRRTRRARAAVVAALARLRQHGFLDWIRRTEPTDREGAGPQVQQVTNAYWFGLPKSAADFVARVLGRAPAPADDELRRAEDAARTAEMIAALPVRERMSLMIDDPNLAEVLSRLGEGIESRGASSPSDQNPAL